MRDGIGKKHDYHSKANSIKDENDTKQSKIISNNMIWLCFDMGYGTHRESMQHHWKNIHSHNHKSIFEPIYYKSDTHFTMVNRCILSLFFFTGFGKSLNSRIILTKWTRYTITQTPSRQCRHSHQRRKQRDIIAIEYRFDTIYKANDKIRQHSRWKNTGK